MVGLVAKYNLKFTKFYSFNIVIALNIFVYLGTCMYDIALWSVRFEKILLFVFPLL